MSRPCKNAAVAVGAVLMALMPPVAGISARAAPPSERPSIRPDHDRSPGITILDRHVADNDWSRDGSLVAYAKRNVLDLYFDIWTIRPDAAARKCLTRTWPRRDGFPRKHVGGVVWHPSGKLLVFTAQNNDATGKRADELAVPGAGLNCNLWAMTPDGEKVWQLTHHKTDLRRPKGIIHPQFSPDGRTLVWAEALGRYPLRKGYEWGEWAIAASDFTTAKGVPALKNLRTYRPGHRKSFYETHDFSPDGANLLFSGNLEYGQPLNGLDIYTLDLSTGAARRLTKTLTDWDEHAHYSPDGKTIAWVSGAKMNVRFPTLRFPHWSRYVKLDLWLMNPDGSRPRRVTFFNQEGHPDREWFRAHVCDSPRIVTSDNSWSPDGTKLALTLAFENPAKRIGSRLVLLDMKRRRE